MGVRRPRARRPHASSQSRPGSSWGHIHRLVPRRAELLLSSKNTTPLLNKHRGSCEIMQHERPGKGLPEILICKRRRLHLPPPGAAKAISEVLPELKAKVRLWTGGPVPGAEGTGWEETLKKGSKQTLAGRLGGGAFTSSLPKSPATGRLHVPCPNGGMEAPGHEVTCLKSHSSKTWDFGQVPPTLKLVSFPLHPDHFQA